MSLQHFLWAVVAFLWIAPSAALGSACPQLRSEFTAHPLASLPQNALPADTAEGRVLLAHEGGVHEVVRGEGLVWRESRRWLAGEELPEGFYGAARYGADGVVLVHQGHGLLRLRAGEVMPIKAPLARRQILDLLPTEDGGLWVAYLPGPFAQGPQVVLERLQGGEVVRSVSFPSASLASLGDWFEVPGRGVFLATRFGVLELSASSAPVRRSLGTATSLAFNGEEILVAGSQLGRLRGERFERLSFELSKLESKGGGRDGGERDGGHRVLGTALDLAVGSDGCWYVLYPEGKLVVVEPKDRSGRLLGAAEGIPSTASRLLLEPLSGTIWIGSLQDGVSLLHTAVQENAVHEKTVSRERAP